MYVNSLEDDEAIAGRTDTCQIKYLRVPDEIIDLVKDQQQGQQGGGYRGRTGQRGDYGGRGDRGRGGRGGPRGRGRGRGQ
jgi:U6 snRNA-associated Sm-like protein LSm4